MASTPDLSPFHLAPDALALGGAADRFHRNIAALTLARDLSDSGRPATDAERLSLAHYTAFGESALLNRLFRYDAAAARYVLLDTYAAILGPDEARHLRRAALTAFYTPLDIAHAIGGAVTRLGLGALDRPRILEPAAGVGHFILTMPPALRAHAEITAVELDPTSARILGRIHPDVALHGGVGFEQADLPSGWFDLAISNVPFGELAVHDDFFAKALRLVRPGGIVVFLTSWGTLDKRSRSVRAHLAEHADLLGAFRLPNGVFRQVSGSESAADLIILQKKPRPASASPSWLA
ncbi:MAG: class I SAM-dependent methyltransferase [Chloroflexales bacterium]